MIVAQDPVQRAHGITGPGAPLGPQDAVHAAGPLLVGLARVMRVGVGLVGLLVAAWLVVAGLRVLRTGEGGDTWLLVAGVTWLVAALRFRPLVFVRAEVAEMKPTLPAWAGVLGVSGLGYVLVGPRHGDLAVLWVHPAVYPAGARYPRMVQRVIGVPGDRVAIRQGHVWRNGALLSEPYCLVPFPGDYEEDEADEDIARDIRQERDGGEQPEPSQDGEDSSGR